MYIQNVVSFPSSGQDAHLEVLFESRIVKQSQGISNGENHILRNVALVYK